MVKYDLHLLGWHDFQRLCLVVCRQILGQTVETFLDSNDAGKDGAFAGKWLERNGEDLSGKFVIQCKFTGKPDFNLTLDLLKDEFSKIEKLVKDNRCDSYILLTNYKVSGVFHSKFEKKLQELGVRHTRIFGSTWITEQIDQSPNLRMLVPRIYGLGDLSLILDERAFKQSRQLLLSMREELSKIVITSAYNKAADALNKHGFVLVVGDPAAGKTTIASLLAMGAIDQWNCNTVKVDNPSQVIQHWNPDEPERFIWVDDAFGVTQYDSKLAREWNHIIPQVKAMLQSGAKIVMTSRNYIYNAARNDLKESAFPLFNESQVVVDVHQLDAIEKQQILYNHLKLGKQSRKFIKAIKTYLPGIALHPRFIPETARRLGDPAFTKDLILIEHSLSNFVSQQDSLLKEVMLKLDRHSRAALGLVYMKNGALSSPFAPSEAEERAIQRLGSDVGSCLAALDFLKDSFLQHTYEDDEAVWKFKHPTIGDAYAKIVSGSVEQLEIYLQGTDIAKVLNVVTCGDMGIEKATIVPKSFFPLLLEKISEYRSSHLYTYYSTARWTIDRQVYNFLARRCSASFLKLFVEQNSKVFTDIVNSNPSFRFDEKIKLVVRLHDENLLPESSRLLFVQNINRWALEGEDLEILRDKGMQSVYREKEFDDLKSKILNELVPSLERVLYNWQSNYSSGDDLTADDHMEGFIELLYILSSEFYDQDGVYDTTDEIEQKTREWIAEKMDSHEEKPKKAERKISFASTTPTLSDRNIFDDIDM